MKYQDNIKAALRLMEDKLFALTAEGKLHGYNVELRASRVMVTIWPSESDCRLFTLYEWDTDKENGWQAVNNWERNATDYIAQAMCDRLQKELDAANARAAAFEVECNNLKAAAAL